jgi:uncharacterized protein
MVGILSLHLLLPGCTSLKEKRGRLKPILARLHREFNISAVEMGFHDKWKESIIACAMLGNDRAYLQAAMEIISRWVLSHWPDGEVLDTKIEIIT